VPVPVDRAVELRATRAAGEPCSTVAAGDPGESRAIAGKREFHHGPTVEAAELGATVGQGRPGVDRRAGTCARGQSEPDRPLPVDRDGTRDHERPGHRYHPGGVPVRVDV
jgi:hypothetical protein